MKDARHLRCAACSALIDPSARHWRHRNTLERACSETCRQMPESLQVGGGDAWELVEAVKAAGGRAA